MEEYEALLEECAETGEIDYHHWPTILPQVIEKLSQIPKTEFPIPRPYPVINPVLPSQRPPDSESFLEKPPTLPSNTPNTPRTLPPVPPFPGSGATTHISNSQPDVGEPDDKDGAVDERLPHEVVQLLNQSLNTLRTSFAEKPPHTIQRLSELTLYPRKHYRTLPAWLRALDRVISVSSGADVFPLSDQPPNVGLEGTNGILNGAEKGGILFAVSSSSNDTRNGYDRDSLGSDESLGGALLTPIPWLKDSDLSATSSTEKVASWQEKTVDAEQPEMDSDMLPTVEGDMATTAAHAEAIAAVAQVHHDAHLPEREDGAVTQGELIRMEQEAGIVPVPHEVMGRVGDQGIELDIDDDADIVRARGPDLVGTVDMGKVAGEERQVRISSPPAENQYAVDVNDAQKVLDGGQPSDSTETEKPADDKTDSADEFVKVEKDDVLASQNDDGDVVLVDADATSKESVDDEKKAT